MKGAVEIWVLTEVVAMLFMYHAIGERVQFYSQGGKGMVWRGANSAHRILDHG